MALGDVTHDRALPRNLLYNQIGGGEGTDNSRIFIPVWTIPFSWSMVVL